MANSEFAYVRQFESQPRALVNTWMVLRLDGRGFHKFSKDHEMVKPNDTNALTVMNEAAIACMKEFPDIVLGYGESDEFSLVLKRDSTLFGRRIDKITTTVVSYFTAQYVMNWGKYMRLEDGTPRPLLSTPHFDARIVCYPTLQNLHDYLSWRQADCHINNLYNTTFWALVQQGGLTQQQAEERLRGTFSKDKNEILFSEFGINYNNEPAMFRKGSVITWEEQLVAQTAEQTTEEERMCGSGAASATEKQTNGGPSSSASVDSTRKGKKAAKREAQRSRKEPTVTHQDVIQLDFWDERQETFPRETLVASRRAQPKGKRSKTKDV
eukprot:m.190539 g.190539  ORF g.190539 m.190539 type:complete len:325 (-) comp14821_c0_seq1:2331-3305(-)